jgi:hypothetical protein
VSLVAAACGLLFAWAVQGARRPYHKVAAVDEASLVGLDRLAVSGRNDRGAVGHTQSTQQAAGGAATSAASGSATAAAQRQQPKGKQSHKLVANASSKKQQEQQKQEQAQQKQKQKQPSQRPGMEDEREWFSKLSAEACA